MTRIYIAAGSGQYAALFRSQFGMDVVADHTEADIICFTGGADVSAELYGDRQHKYTYNDSVRDRREAALFHYCVVESIPMVGICRGGQFLNVMSGGRMYQHVENHTHDHWLTDKRTGEQVFVSSTHHQMMLPGDKALVLGIADQQGSREWYNGQIFERDQSNTDIEVLYYEHTKSLCFQPHPEFTGYPQMKAWFKGLVEEFLLVKQAA